MAKTKKIVLHDNEYLQRMLYRDFLLEKDLYKEAGLENLSEKLAKQLGCNAEQAIEKLTAEPLLVSLSLKQLKNLLTIRDMALISRTAADVAADLKSPGVSYDTCCRTALCYSVAEMEAHVFSALRSAAAKNDTWARHHFLYGLILGLGGNFERACWELGMALEREPYEESKVRIRHAMERVCDKNVPQKS
ncbi:MAG: hypothetical protein V1754_06880 [Pseudomonadota bacterium]